MLNGPVAAASRLDKNIAVDAPPKKLSQILTDLIEKENAVDQLEAADIAQRWYSRFEKRARHDIYKAEEEGGFLKYAFNSANEDFVQGACFVERCDSELIKIEKAARAKQERYLEFYKDLTPLRFEKLCGKVVSLLGVSNPSVTKSSSDQGVDFFGELPLGRLLSPKEISPGAEKQLAVWLVGQAKHFVRTSVSTKDIRELVGSIILARSKVFAGQRDPLSDLKMRVCDPVIFLFITTGRFTRDSRELLMRSGVVALDGIQLSVFLADNLAGQNGGELTLDTLENWIDE